MSFDPYHLWLGIPPAERPPNHYRLLGVPLWEPDPRVIEAAADRQMGHLRNYQTGQHAAESQRLLNEVAAARVCLLNAEKRAAYDAALLEATGEAAGNVAADEWAGPAAVTISTAATRRRASSVRPLVTVAGILLCGFAGLGLAMWAMRTASEQPRGPRETAAASPSLVRPAATKAPSPAAPPKAPPKNDDLKLLVGTWVATKLQSKEVWIIHEDGSVVMGTPSSSPGYTGKWTATDTQVRIQWRDAKYWEILMRPIQAGGVRGVAWNGVEISVQKTK